MNIRFDDKVILVVGAYSGIRVNAICPGSTRAKTSSNGSSPRRLARAGEAARGTENCSKKTPF